MSADHVRINPAALIAMLIWSGASVAGLRLLLEERVISRSDRVVCILTGHQLKDPEVTVNYHREARDGTGSASFSNPPLPCAADIDAIAKLLGA